jgi:hypothetical protein
MKKVFKNSVLNRIGSLTAAFLKARHNANFVVPYGMDLPKRTCKRYGVTLKISRRKDLQIQIVTVLKYA